MISLNDVVKFLKAVELEFNQPNPNSTSTEHFDVSLQLDSDGSGIVMYDNNLITCQCGQGCNHEYGEIWEYEFDSLEQLDEHIRTLAKCRKIPLEYDKPILEVEEVNI